MSLTARRSRSGRRSRRRGSEEALSGVTACLSADDSASINEQHAEQDAEISRESDPADLLLENRRVLLSERVMTLIASGRQYVAAALRAYHCGPPRFRR